MLLIAGQIFTCTLVIGLVACGGGGSQNPPPPPTPDFSLALNPTGETVQAGSSASVSLSATVTGGFSSPISVQVTGVPAGVTLSPTSITLTPGTPQQVTFAASAGAASSNANLIFTGTSGSLQHTAGLSLTVKGVSNGAPVRTRYVRTDATTEYFGWVNQHWILYHQATGRYFVADTSSNQIIVLDAPSQTVIARIGVPGAFGMDDTPDHSTIYMGTQVGDVYAIDPVAMAVTQRYIASEIGVYGFAASQVLVLADGRLALIGLYNGIDGTGGLALWNPSDNSTTVYGGLGGIGLPCGGFYSLGGFARSVDRTQLFLGAINGGAFCGFNPATGVVNVNAAGSSLHITTSPDGKYVILPNYPTGVTVFDAQTLAQVSQFNVLGNTADDSAMFVSSDSSTLYVPTDSIIYAYSLSTQQLVGWAPNIYVPPISGGSVFGPIDSPYLLATDGSGLFAGPIEEGVGFVDLSVLQTGPVGTQFTNGYLNPATGPVSGGTATQWPDPNPVGPLKSIYFGSQQASNISASSGTISATSPAGQAGPADVYAFTTDGGMQLLPQAFSYGPTILEVTPNMATAEGGGTGYLYGYGFGPTTSGSIPSGLTVTVGGVTVPVTAFAGNAYGSASPPMPLQGLAYTIPPSTSGTAADVSVTTNSGSAKAAAALSYLPAIQPFPLPGSTLAQGIYDPYTDLYYFTDTTKIQVFSRTQRQWLSPITLPVFTERLWGIALSPDGTKMAISDLMDGNIYVLNPTNPASVQTFFVGTYSPFLINPSGLAISDAGSVYYMVEVIGQGGGADQFFKLNTNTGTIYNYGIDSPGLGPGDAYLRNAISSDNARVFYNDYGYVFSIDTATDTIFPSSNDIGCCYGNYELALSSNQTQLTASFYIYDSNLNSESYYALNDREIINLAYVYGAKLSPDGRLLFQPSTNGIDVLDGNLGNLLYRISLPVALSANYDALVADGADNVLVAITGTSGNGVAIVDLTSIPEPNPPGYMKGRTNGNRPGRVHVRTGSESMRNEVRPAAPMRIVPHITRTLPLPPSKWMTQGTHVQQPDRASEPKK